MDQPLNGVGLFIFYPGATVDNRYTQVMPGYISWTLYTVYRESVDPIIYGNVMGALRRSMSGGDAGSAASYPNGPGSRSTIAGCYTSHAADNVSIRGCKHSNKLSWGGIAY